MQIGELWNNEMLTKFMKVNNMSMNENKFFSKLKNLKYNRTRKER